jgi:hypothetical protein
MSLQLYTIPPGSHGLTIRPSDAINLVPSDEGVCKLSNLTIFNILLNRRFEKQDV